MFQCSLQANPPQFDRVEDVAGLRYLNESSVLHTLRQRYGSNLIHTYAGQALYIINPMHQLSIYSDKVCFGKKMGKMYGRRRYYLS